MPLRKEEKILQTFPSYCVCNELQERRETEKKETNDKKDDEILCPNDFIF